MSKCECASEAVLDLDAREFQNMDGLYEPSDIVQLQDGRLLVIEDEPSRAFSLLSPLKQENILDIEVLRSPIAARLAGPSGQFSDLEGLVQGPQYVIYAITSHSWQGNGKRDPDREKLVRLTIEEDRIGQISVRSDLRERLIDAFFNTQEDYQFDENLQLLDLDGGGIRDIVSDPILYGYLIVSQREGTKSEKAFKLWFWDGSSAGEPRRVKIEGVEDLQRTEGIAAVSLAGMNLL